MSTTQSSTLDDAYFDRNLLALAFARLALERGWVAGLRVDPAEPEWPVLYVETPQGQVSWHLPAREVRVEEWPVYPSVWDGHDLEEKRRRISACATGGTAGPAPHR